MNKKRGQVSFEYLVIIAFSITILLAAIYVVYSYSVNSNDQFTSSRIEDTGKEIIKTIENLYYSTGEGSIIHLELNIPTGIHDAYFTKIGSESEFVIDYGLSRGRTQSIFFTSVLVNQSCGIGCNSNFFLDGDPHSGTLNLKLSNIKGGVKVEEVI